MPFHVHQINHGCVPKLVKCCAHGSAVLIKIGKRHKSSDMPGTYKGHWGIKPVIYHSNG